MPKFAVIETGGKQYKVSAGQKIKVEKLSAKEDGSTPLTAGDSFVFDKILLAADGDKVSVGAPYLDGEKVSAKVIKQARERKKIVFRYHSKTRYRKKKGHRQHFTEVEIVSV
ncbi:MAG: 50S ribosomal protein L21 [Patescibacteria group bacterium]